MNWYRSEQNHRRRNERLKAFSVASSVITAIAAIGSAVFALGAFVEARRQADISQTAFSTQTRAWVSADLSTSKNGIEDAVEPYGGPQMQFGLKFVLNLENEGSSPAVDIQEKVRVVLLDPLNVPQDAGVVCNGGLQIGDVTFQTLFMHHSLSADVITPIDPQVIQSYLERQYAPPMSPQDVANRPAFVLEECLTYHVLGDTSLKHTASTFFLHASLSPSYKEPLPSPDPEEFESLITSLQKLQAYDDVE